MKNVREYDDVRAEARRLEEVGHFARVEKNDMADAIFHDLGNSPATFEASRWADFLGRVKLPMRSRLTLKGLALWVELPREGWPEDGSWKKGRNLLRTWRSSLKHVCPEVHGHHRKPCQVEGCQDSIASGGCEGPSSTQAVYRRQTRRMHVVCKHILNPDVPFIPGGADESDVQTLVQGELAPHAASVLMKLLYAHV